jgi:hypothetical protein
MAELVTTSKVKLKRQPKSVINVRGRRRSRHQSSVYQVPPPRRSSSSCEDVQRLEQKVNEATYADLFMAITNMQGIQPRNIEEIAARNEEKLTQLGPVIERVNNEKLKVVIDRVFGIMSRARCSRPRPTAMRNQPEIKIEFVSILTQMQRMVGLGQIERTVNFVGSVSAIYPEARFKLDPMEMVDEYARSRWRSRQDHPVDRGRAGRRRCRGPVMRINPTPLERLHGRLMRAPDHGAGDGDGAGEGAAAAVTARTTPATLRS